MNATRLVVLLCVWASCPASADITWPEPSMPGATQLASLGDQMSINGIPTRIFTFESSAPADAVIKHFRDQIDADFTEVPRRHASEGAATLGGRNGDFWLTLKVQQQRRGAKGTWSATPRFMPNVQQAVVTPAGFPGSAKLIQQIDSYDAGKRSQMAIGIDPSAVDGVAHRLEEQLRELGFSKQALPAKNWPTSDRYVAVFSKAREEIWVSLQQQKSGTAVTINRLSALEVLE